jgi:hypothetical protein
MQRVIKTASEEDTNRFIGSLSVVDGPLVRSKRRVMARRKTQYGSSTYGHKAKEIVAVNGNFLFKLLLNSGH